MARVEKKGGSVIVSAISTRILGEGGQYRAETKTFRLLCSRFFLASTSLSFLRSTKVPLGGGENLVGVTVLLVLMAKFGNTATRITPGWSPKKV